MKELLFAFLVLLLAWSVPHAQGEIVTSFENGSGVPEGWKLTGAPGKWDQQGRTGARSISVSGDGEVSGAWTLPCRGLEPNRPYRFSVWCKSEQKDAPRPGGISVTCASLSVSLRHTPEWTCIERIFRAPSNTASQSIRLGHYRFNGTIWFDDFQLEPVHLVYADQKGIVLDEHERIENGTYIFEPDFKSGRTICCRVADDHTARFTNDRWYFYRDQYFVDRYVVNDRKQRSAEIQLTTLESSAPADSKVITIEACTDGLNWQEVGLCEKTGDHRIALPSDLFPAEHVFVRVSGDGRTVLRKYRYAAALSGPALSLKGSTDVVRPARVTVDTGQLQLTFEEGASQLVGIARRRKPLGVLESLIAYFERSGIGHKGTGIGTPQATRVKSLEIKENDARHCVVLVTAERLSSYELARRFEATYEFTVYAGQNWFGSRLLSVRNTGSIDLAVRGYFHRLQPAADAALKPWCFPQTSAWLSGKGILGALSTADDEFTLGLRLADGTPQGDITRAFDRTLPAGDIWNVKEPMVIVYVARGEKPYHIVKESRAVRERVRNVGRSAGKLTVTERSREPIKPTGI